MPWGIGGSMTRFWLFRRSARRWWRPFLGRGWALGLESSNARFGGSRGVVVIGEPTLLALNLSNQRNADCGKVLI